MWMESPLMSMTSLMLHLVACLAILFFTAPYGPILCAVLWFLDLARGHPDPLVKGHGQSKNVAIIGGGVAGITSAKALLEEGHNPTILEKDANFGGVWQFSMEKGAKRDKGFTGQVWQDLITTSSAYVTSFSDFRPEEFIERKEHPYHMTCKMYYEYLEAYMKYGKIDQKKHLQLNTEVKSCTKVSNGWELEIVKDSKITKRTFDYVVVSTGQHQCAKKPSETMAMEGEETPALKSLSEFKGEIVHSSNYINSKQFEGKRVLIVGGGDSGGDIVKHIADVCKPGECYMSLRRGAHVTPRYFHKDTVPIDYAMYRFAYCMPHVLRTNVLREAFHKVLRTVAATDKTTHWILTLHNINGMGASNYFTSKSEEMCKAFAAGTAFLKPGVKKFTADGCEFEPLPKRFQMYCPDVDCSPVKLDAVILCTGFEQKFPFLPKGSEAHGHLDRYRLVFHPDLDDMAFVGFARPAGFGAIPPCAEIQARWMAQVVSGKALLPRKSEMLNTINIVKKDFKAVRKTPNQSLIFFPYYLAEIAREFGANPRMFNLFFSNPKLWYRVAFGMYNSTQYRLYGPHAKFEETAKFLMERMPVPNVKDGPVSRPPVPVLLVLSVFFGVVAKVPYFGTPFVACV